MGIAPHDKQEPMSVAHPCLLMRNEAALIDAMPDRAEARSGLTPARSPDVEPAALGEEACELGHVI